MKFVAFILSAAGPSLVVVVLMLVSALFNPLLSATWLGMGAGSMFSPAMLLGTIATALAARVWWHGLLGIGLSYAISRAFFIKPVDSFDSTSSYELNSAFGAIAVGLLIVGFVSLIKMALERMSNAR